jgi:ribosomal protein S18 acetylase RimI-like enzyme
MANTSVEILPVEPADVEELGALARVIWLAHYSSIIGIAQIDYMLEERYAPEVILEELTRNGLWWDKLLVNGAMAGFASYFLVEGGAMKLDKIYVHPAHQRNGHGGRLIGRALAAAAAHRCATLMLAVNKNNRQAIEAYLKHGFTIAESVVKDIGGGFVMDDYIMVREVAGNV